MNSKRPMTDYRPTGNYEADAAAWDAMVASLYESGLELVDDLEPFLVEPDGTEWYHLRPVKRNAVAS